MIEQENRQRGLIPVEDGYWALIDKPEGVTSHDVVDAVRRISGEKKVGHAGTLDPMATGLLVVAIGKVTKQIETWLTGDKAYIATARFGLVSRTGDTDVENLVEVETPPFTDQQVRDAVKAIASSSNQIPPLVSALKVEGWPLYKVSRRGWWLPRGPRPVSIRELELLSYDTRDRKFEMTISGGGGLYVRAIVRDIGMMLGAPAALIALRRIGVGDFSVEQAVTLEEFEQLWQD